MPAQNTPPTETPAVEVAEMAQDVDKFKKAVTAYLQYNIVSKAIQNVPDVVKLAIVQVTPEDMILTRTIG